MPVWMLARELALFSLFALHAAAQQYPFILAPGSPKSIGMLFQDSRGRLWMQGSPPSLFDGTRFFSLEDYGLPPHTIVRAFAEDPSGAVWLAADTGVFRYFAGHIEPIRKGEDYSIISPARDVALAAMDGVPLNRFLIRISRAAEGWKSETVFPLDSPGPLAPDSAGMVLFPWPRRGWSEFRTSDILAWKSGTPPPPVVRHPVPNAPGNGALKAMRDVHGCFWMGAPGGDSAECPGPADGKPPPVEHAFLEADMHETVDGGMILWGGSILVVGPYGRYRGARAANGLPALSETLGARDGTVWLATPEGLYRFPSPFRIEYWTAREGLQTPPWSFARIGDKVYAGLVDEIVTLSKDRLRWEHFASFAGSDTTALLALGDSMLASTIYGGTYLFSRAGKLLAHSRPNDAGANMRLARGPNGEIWRGGSELGTLRRSGSFLEFDRHPLEGNPHGNVLSIQYQEQTRRLWACYNNGLLMRDEYGIWHRYTTADGLKADDCWSLASLPNGDVWDAMSAFGGISLIHPRVGGGISVATFDKNRIEDAGSTVLSVDAAGRLWRGGGAASYAATPDQAAAAQWLKLNDVDGFRPDMNSGSFFVDKDGSFWVGMDNDIFHYTPPPDLTEPKFAPEVFVSAYSWEGTPPRLADSVTAIPHGVKAVAHLGSLQFDRRNALRIRYRVLPGAPEWRESAGLDVPLAGLASGSHSIEFQARVFTGPWSKKQTQAFTVLVPAWRTQPLLVSYALALSLLGAFFYLTHRRRLAEDAELLPDLAAVRVRAFLPEVQEIAGTVLDGRFEVGNLIARGGFANVMEGHDRLAGQRCAIKVFRAEIGSKEWIRRRFEDEVSALGKIHHPNVVSIYAHGVVPSGSPYLVMEFVEGRDLSEILAEGPLPPHRAGAILQQLADALDCIHALGIWHRDVKPDNIVIGPDGRAVLIDFSIAIVKDANETLHGLSRAAGTFAYMAPEQAIGHAEPSSDIYGLARVVIEMLLGRPVQELLPAAALDLPARLTELLRNASLRLSEESIRMLAAAQEFDPGRRPAAASTFARPIVEDLLRSSSASAGGV